MKDMSRRIKLFFISENLLPMILEKRELILNVKTKFPRGSNIRKVFYDAMRQGWVIVVSHSSFDIVDQGAIQPVTIVDIQIMRNPWPLKEWGMRDVLFIARRVFGGYIQKCWKLLSKPFHRKSSEQKSITSSTQETEMMTSDTTLTN